MSFASRLKDARLAKGYTQEDLATKLGLQKSAVAKYESGRIRNIKKETLDLIGEILECSPAYLMGWQKPSVCSTDESAKRKIFYNYAEPPQMVRIKSEALCLDHTFSPLSSCRCLGIGDCIKLANSPFIDSVQMLLAEENNAYYPEPITDIGKVYLLGWVDAGLYEDGGGQFQKDRNQQSKISGSIVGG